MLRLLVVGVEGLGHRERVLRDERHVLDRNRLLDDLFAARHQQQQRPGEVALLAGEKGRQVESQRARHERGAGVTFGGQLAEDVPGAHHRVLQVGAGLAGEGERLLHVEGDDPGAREAQQEVAKRAHRHRRRRRVALLRIAARVARVDLGLRLGDECVDQVVGLHAQSLASRDLDGVLVLPDLVAERPRRGGREHHLLVGEVVRAQSALLVPERLDAGAHHALRVRLADVDHVVDSARVAEARGAGLALAARGGPERPSVGQHAVNPIAEVAVELAQLPELVGDVLAGVRDRAVRANDDLVLVDRFALALGHRQHPAALVLARGFEAQDSLLAHQLECAIPEVQAQDVALVREQLVVDVEPRHRREMAVDDPPRHVLREPRGVVVARLDLVQHLGLQRLRLGVLGVVLADARVEVPAVVVEPARDPLDSGERLLLEVQEAHHDVGHLDAGVVDVVLDSHVEAAVAQQPHEGVAEAGVPEVADVRGLVRVDARVLDDHVARATLRRPPIDERLVQVRGDLATLEEQVEVAAARHLGPHHVTRRAQLAGEQLRDLAGLSAQRLGQVERGRQGQVPELHPGRILERDAAGVDVEGGARGRFHRA